MEINGKIIQSLPEQGGKSKTGNSWRKQDFILETQAEFPKKICFSIWGEKIDQFKVQEGEYVIVHIDIESREFNGRWYTDVKAWKIERSIEGSTDKPADNMVIITPSIVQSQEDDLPF
jgi:hypothetical protein